MSYLQVEQSAGQFLQGSHHETQLNCWIHLAKRYHFETFPGSVRNL